MRAAAGTASGILAALLLGACAGSTGSAAAGSETTGVAPPVETTDSTPSAQPRTEVSENSAPVSDEELHGDRGGHGGMGRPVDPKLLLPAYLGAAPFQDVEVAEAAGWSSTVDTLGCFEQPGLGGMGVHWLNESLLDDVVDPADPEALVYEIGANGEVVGLVGHEYLVPTDAWSDDDPPNLFGLDFHPHPSLPFWILHAYLWKDNPAGTFEDWNPAVRMCPDGVEVFGRDASTDDPPDQTGGSGDS